MTDEITTLSPTAAAEPPPKLTATERLEIFDKRFRQVCLDTGISAAAFILDRSQPGTIGVMARGDTETIQFIQHLVDKTSLAASYRAEREERRAAAYAKRNPQVSSRDGHEEFEEDMK